MTHIRSSLRSNSTDYSDLTLRHARHQNALKPTVATWMLMYLRMYGETSHEQLWDFVRQCLAKDTVDHDTIEAVLKTLVAQEVIAVSSEQRIRLIEDVSS